MKSEDPICEILSITRSYWDREDTRPGVRSAFINAVNCRTPKLGAEIFSSDSESRIFNHSCKSSACTSCGHRATSEWQRGWFAVLPETAYKCVTFTMPDVLWRFFRENRHLLDALPALASKLLQIRALSTQGARIGVISVLHTFNGKLEFNPHVHTLLSAGGLVGSRWIDRIFYDQDGLTAGWRTAVVALLRQAFAVGALRTHYNDTQLETLLQLQESRWWSVKIQSFQGKRHFLLYAGRYVKRPPIARRRIKSVSEVAVVFRYKDKKLRRDVVVTFSPQQFVDRLEDHIRDRGKHGSRNFGLFSSRALSQMGRVRMRLAGQPFGNRPKRVRWATLLVRTFHRHPLFDRHGRRMVWTGRLRGR